jgi:predicted YcjX-like family ATPase
MNFTDIIDTGRIAAGGLKDFASGLGTPAIRVGVTGLARSGKTVFITALVNALLKGAKLPLFEAHASQRIERAYLEPQPDDELPRFAYESHISALTGDARHWPDSTKRLSQLRLTLDYTSHRFFARQFGSGRVHIDIIDYPGEWLLDLPLMSMGYPEWSRATVAASRSAPRLALTKDWHAHLATLRPDQPANEIDAVKAAELFTAYLAKCRQREVSLSTLPPGRFLMPGDLAGSPLLTFAPLDIDPAAPIAAGSLAALMARRYASYVAKVVKPFFFDHFARLDRQIVLVDVLSALNAGPAAVQDLKRALTGVLACFRQGANSWTSALFGRRIDRILFAATKADQLHHTSHDRLEAILKLMVDEASSQAEFSGAETGALALAAIRATREATVKHKGEELPCIVGVPEAGETIGGDTFNGETEAAVFPGDLPADPQVAMQGGLEDGLRFVRFRPPPPAGQSFPHIRLDRALEFLFGDRLA